MAEHGGVRPASRATGLCERQLQRWKDGHARPEPTSLERLQRAARGEGDPDPEARARRVELMAERVERGLEPFTGRPAPARRSCAEAVRLFLAADEDLAAQAVMLDRQEDARERREREALARGQELEDDADDDDQGGEGAFLRLLSREG